jgi:pyrimidine operon attenuation protein / uracil phosphoribosyltransferase
MDKKLKKNTKGLLHKGEGFFLTADKGAAMKKKKKVMDSEAIRRALLRVAHEVVERNKGVKDLVLIGIRRGGEQIAIRLARIIEEIERKPVPCGFMDVTMYRDDLYHMSHQPEVHKTEINFPIEDKVVILVDDVLFTGRTIRAAMDSAIDYGRPRQIQLAVLIDRGHREFPIRADFVGRNIPTSRTDLVQVTLDAQEKKDKVELIETGGTKEQA